MADHIWLVRNPEGRVIGASAHGRQDALLDARNDENVYPRHERALAAYSEYNGYTLTRTPLPAAAPVVVLDEWRVVNAKGRVVRTEHITQDDAEGWASNCDFLHHENAPHRVMRVCLQSVEVPDVV